MASAGPGARDALVEALAGRFAHHARAARTDVAEQIRAAFRAAGFTGGYLDAGRLVGALPPGVGGLPAAAELTDDALVTLLDDDGAVLVVEDRAAPADHTHPAAGGPPTGAAGGDLTGVYPNPQIAAGVVTDADVAAANKDGVAGTPSLRTLGAGPQQAAAGSHAHAGYVSNPMTAPQDIIVGGTGGAPTRLGVGGAGQVLTVVGGVLTWAAPPGGLDQATADGLYVNVTGDTMTGTLITRAVEPDGDGYNLGRASNRWDTVYALLGDFGGFVFITPATPTDDALRVHGGGDTQDRLSVRADGRMRWGPGTAALDTTLERTGVGALSVNAKALAASPDAGNGLVWNANGFYVPTPTPGMSNPMTSPGDVIVGGAAGAAGRLGVGAADQVLAVAAGAPVWRAPAAVDNLLSNPGFEIWQRGAGPFTASTLFTADRWDLALNLGSTGSVTREAAIVDAASQYALACAYTHVAGGSGLIRQRLEDFYQVRGRTVACRVRVRSTVVGTVKLRLNDGTTSYDSAYNATTGWETLSVVVAVPASATALVVQLRADVASCTFQVDNATLVAGSAPVDYVPLHPAQDLVRCQRYYQEMGGLATNEFFLAGQCISATDAWVPIVFPLEMALSPTASVSAPGDFVVFTAGGGALVCTALAVGALTRRGCRIQATVASGLVAGNATMLRTNATLAARIKFEANP